MNRQQVLDMLWQRFIEPTRRLRPLFTGVELEMPLVNQSGAAVDFTVVHALTEHFLTKAGLQRAALDSYGNTFSVHSPQTGDVLSYDCSYNNLEFSFGRTDDLHQVLRRFERYFCVAQEFLGRHGHGLTGMGINPRYRVNHHQPIPTARYRMLYHHLSKAATIKLPRYLHHYYNYGMFTSASQIQCDVSFEQLVPTLVVHNLLEPLKAVLFANSPFYDAGVQYLCGRDFLWANSMQGYNPHNVGSFEQLPATPTELLSYLSGLSIYCARRQEKYLTFLPLPIVDYFAQPHISGEYFALGSYHQMEFMPERDDLNYLRSYKFTDLTFRGTIEWRSCCCQPVRDAMSVAAFHLGLMGKEQTEHLKELLTADTVLFGQGFTHAELRALLVCEQWPQFINRNALRSLLLSVLEVARGGLEQRGLGEEVYLNCLFERAERLENPAQRMLRMLASGVSLEKVIADYAVL
ncbi:MAG: hypothetical protein LBU07_01575 [Coriobacteriales bacterium]|nr:hypothetical protein [Coriobacteriales bacterium]